MLIKEQNLNGTTIRVFDDYIPKDKEKNERNKRVFESVCDRIVARMQREGVTICVK